MPSKTLRSIFPNVGIEVAYRRRLEKLITAMHDSIAYWVTAKYRNNEPVIAQDGKTTPAIALKKAVKKLTKQWQSNFDDLAQDMAEHFAKAVYERTNGAMKAALKQSGFAVEFNFKMTKAQQDIFKATVQQNVSLIKSIPQQYLTNVEGMVMRSVQTGRDLGALAKDLQSQFGVTKRRAALIARDQNNKATSALQRARQIELGVTEAIWMHSHAGKEPRPSHVAMNGKKYDVTKGMWDKDEKEWIFPGQLINCRCTSRAVIAGFS